MSKLTMMITGAAGYVLGSKAGRERYEWIKASVRKVAQDPRVRAKAKDASSKARRTPVLKDKVASAASGAKDTVKDKTSSSTDTPQDTGTDTSSTTGTDTPLVTGMDPAPVTGTSTSPTSSYPAS